MTTLVTLNNDAGNYLQQVLTAPDQLRQRVAWALAQIFTIGESGVSKTDEPEPWAVYYDIFVRHAFGNIRDILKEVTFNPMMAKYLTYDENKAFGFAGTFPDENYAREIMQLFSVGLWKLNEDGTPVIEAVHAHKDRHRHIQTRTQART